MGIDRRKFLQLSAAGLWLPAPLWAGSGETQRRFLFVYCKGGWDTTFVFSPMGNNPEIDTEIDAVEIESNGIRHVDHQSRPAVRRFFEQYGSETCVINGFEVRSIAHDKAQRLLFTGSPGTEYDDWGSLLAFEKGATMPLPYINVSGPSYAARAQEVVARLGSNGQLNTLLKSDHSSRPSSIIESLEDQLVMERANQGVHALDGQMSRVLGSLGGAESLVDSVEFTGGVTFAERLSTVVDCFELDVSRCGIVQYDGHQDLGWDSHGANFIQANHFQELFTALSDLMTDLHQRPGPNGGVLSDEVCVVVLSEMGRHPKLNNNQGKHHWTFTSAMLLGAGVAGRQVIGKYDSNFFGMPIDLKSGELDDLGEPLTAKNFGATILALGGIEPELHTGGVAAIEAAIK